MEEQFQYYIHAWTPPALIQMKNSGILSSINYSVIRKNEIE